MLRHRVRHARLRLTRPEQAELLREALPIALDQALPEDGRLRLLRRLPVSLQLAEDAGLDEAVARLRQALRRALAEADPLMQSGDAVCVDDAQAALVEAWSDALSGRRDRGWAWARLGLWPQAEAPLAALLPGLLAALDRLPLLADELQAAPEPAARRLQLLERLVARRLLVRLLGLLQPPDWLRLAGTLPGAELLQAALQALPSRSPTADPAPAWPPGSEAAACLAALHSAPLSPAAWPVAALGTRWLAQLLGAPAQLLPAASALALAPAWSAWAQTAAQSRVSSSRSAPPTAEPVAADLPDAGPWPSQQAGLLHLLPLLTVLPPAALQDRQRLLRLALQGLGLPPDDAVLAPWMGCRAPQGWTPPDADAEQTAADRDLLQAALEARLQRHLPAAVWTALQAEWQHDELDALAWLLRRDARLHAVSGGWRADFAEPDLRLRRAGLDRDPGPCPWLGLAVVFRYE
jgi:hypothetical protein